MRTMFVQALFGVCGLVLIGLAVSKLRSPPERGRPDSMSLYVNHFFEKFGLLLIGTLFAAFGAGALFFGLRVGVAPWQQFVQAVLFALGVTVARWAWKRARERPRP